MVGSWRPTDEMTDSHWRRKEAHSIIATVTLKWETASTHAQFEWKHIINQGCNEQREEIDNPAQGPRGPWTRAVLPRLRVQDCRSHMPDANFFWALPEQRAVDWALPEQRGPNCTILHAILRSKCMRDVTEHVGNGKYVYRREREDQDAKWNAKRVKELRKMDRQWTDMASNLEVQRENCTLLIQELKAKRLEK